MGNSNAKKIHKAANGMTRILKFKRRRLSFNDVLALSYALMNESNRIASLEIHSTGMTMKGLARLGDGLMHENSRVIRLGLYHDHFGPIGGRILSDVLTRAHCPIVSLILQNNAIGNEGAMIIAEALKHPNNRIHVLYLLNNNIGMEGARAIAEALKHENNKVVELSLTGNPIGLEGTSFVAQAIKSKNNNIHYLRLGHCNIDNRGAAVLARAIIHENSRLHSLDLETNQVSDTRDLTKAMKLSRLQWADLSFNSDNPYDQERIFADIRHVFFEKRQYWRLIITLCALHDVPRLAKRNKNGRKCHLAMLSKDLVRELALMVYPWVRSEKMMMGFM